MTRDELEAVVWQNMPVTPRSPASAARVDAILTAADAYKATPPGTPHHVSDTDLHPVIRVLAEALNGEQSC